MSDQALSALLDGECTDAELTRLLRDMDGTPELAQRWTRLCRSRDFREGVRIPAGQTCIALAVMAQLESEPAVHSRSSKIVPITAALRQRLPKVSLRPLVGFAAAASMGGAAVLLLSPSQAPEPMAGSVVTMSDSLPASLSSPEHGLQTTVGYDTAAQGWPSSTFDESAAAQRGRASEQLREYLMDHSNSVGDQGVGGTLRYARFAAHTTDYRVPAEEQR